MVNCLSSPTLFLYSVITKLGDSCSGFWFFFSFPLSFFLSSSLNNVAMGDIRLDLWVCLGTCQSKLLCTHRTLLFLGGICEHSSLLIQITKILILCSGKWCCQNKFLKKERNAVLLHVIHRSRQRTLTWNMHSTFESTSMASRFLLPFSKTDPVWLNDF